MGTKTRRVVATVDAENNALFASNYGFMVQVADELGAGIAWTVIVPQDYVSGGTIYFYYSSPGTGTINTTYWIGAKAPGSAFAWNEDNGVNGAIGVSAADTLYSGSFVLDGGYATGDMIYGLLRRRTGDANTSNLYLKGIEFEYTAAF